MHVCTINNDDIYGLTCSQIVRILAGSVVHDRFLNNSRTRDTAFRSLFPPCLEWS